MLDAFSELQAKVQSSAQKVLKDFRGFVFKQNVLSLAIGVIIGTATSTVVNAINADLLMPAVNLCFPDQQWKTFGPVISKYRDASGKLVQNKLLLGDLAYNLANLLVIGVLAYVVTRLILDAMAPPPPPPPPPARQCPFCLESVLQAATRCKFCTSELPPLPPEPAPPALQA